LVNFDTFVSFVLVLIFCYQEQNRTRFGVAPSYHFGAPPYFGSSSSFGFVPADPPGPDPGPLGSSPDFGVVYSSSFGVVPSGLPGPPGPGPGGSAGTTPKDDEEDFCY
jgi:hypothetical protein